jgi:predicted RNase H-like HicB family nuclease
MAMKYKVVLRLSEEGYSVSVPGLPGCWSQGATEEEAIENIRDAIHEYVETAHTLLGFQPDNSDKGVLGFQKDEAGTE